MRLKLAALALFFFVFAPVLAGDPSLFVRVDRKTADDLALLRSHGIPVVMSHQLDKTVAEALEIVVGAAIGGQGAVSGGDVVSSGI